MTSRKHIHTTLAFVITLTLILVGFGVQQQAAAVPIAVGTEIGVDIGHANHGTAPNWNALTSTTTVPAGSVVRLSDGAVVDGVSLTRSGGASDFPYVSTAPSFPDEVRNDNAWIDSGSIVLTFSGLHPNFLYDWISTSSDDGGPFQGSINELTLSGLVGGPQSTGNFVISPGSEQSFSGIQPDAGGQITATVTLVSGPYAILNGARLEAVSAISELGDFNGDTVVDLADFDILRNHMLAHLDGPVAYADGDIDFDGDVDLDDFGKFKEYFPGAVAAATSVPEPSSLALALWVLAGIAALVRCPGYRTRPIEN